MSFPRTLTCPTRCPLEPLPSLRSISTRDATSPHGSSEPLPSDHAPEAPPTPAVTLANAPASLHPGNPQRMTFLTSFKSSTYTNNLGLLASATVPTATPRSPPWSHSHCCPRLPDGSFSHDSLARPPQGPPMNLEGPAPIPACDVSCPVSAGDRLGSIQLQAQVSPKPRQLGLSLTAPAGTTPARPTASTCCPDPWCPGSCGWGWELAADALSIFTGPLPLLSRALGSSPACYPL